MNFFIKLTLLFTISLSGFFISFKSFESKLAASLIEKTLEGEEKNSDNLEDPKLALIPDYNSYKSYLIAEFIATNDNKPKTADLKNPFTPPNC